jgi:hypothetical protein
MLNTVLFATLVGQVGFTLVNPMQVTEIKQIQFGDILNQSNVSCRLTSQSREGIGCISSPSAMGEFHIVSSVNENVQIRVYSNLSQDVEFLPLLANQTTEQSYQLTNKGVDFSVGGELTIKRALTDGEHKITYTVEVNY